MKAAAKPKGKVLKTLQDLQQEKRIELAAIGIFHLVFKGEKEYAFKPREGTQLHRVWSMKRLNLRQQRGWTKFLKDCDEAIGKSGGITSAYGALTGGGEPSGKTLVSYTNKAFDDVDYIVNRYLTTRERTLLRDLIQDHLKATDNLQLEFIGWIMSGYSDPDNARTAAVVHIQNLGDRLATFYNF